MRSKRLLCSVSYLTDCNPEKGPGDYREVHQGSILLGSI